LLRQKKIRYLYWTASFENITVPINRYFTGYLILEDFKICGSLYLSDLRHYAKTPCTKEFDTLLKNLFLYAFLLQKKLRNH